jgi:D-amino-acid dehydrogenase
MEGSRFGRRAVAAGGPGTYGQHMTSGGYRVPARVLVVGAGMVGLCCAWSLQEHGIEVVVADRAHEGAGSSWQNAGYVAPALTVPLPEPSILRYGARAVLSPGAPVRLRAQPDLRLAQFMTGLVRHCTTRAWRHAMSAYLPLNRRIFDAYDRQRDGGVAAELHQADVLDAFEDSGEARGMLHELANVAGSGQRQQVELLTGDEARELEPHLSARVTLAARIPGQRYLTPASYVAALAEAVRSRNGKILAQTPVTSVHRAGGKVLARGPAADLDADAVVLATGAWLSPLARPHGVQVPVYGGRGYSFTLPCDEPFRHLLHFGAARVAVAPQGDRVRVTGIMEFGSPDAAPQPARIRSMVRAARPLLDGVDWAARADDWMGARPLTTDGMPLIGESRTPGVFVAGGHGMWGVTLGPLTGQLLAEQIATGVQPPELRPLDPCR